MSDYVGIISGSLEGNSKQQTAGPLPYNASDRTNVPMTGSVNKTPNYVVIGALNSEVGFYLSDSASYSTKHTAQGTASIPAGTNYGGNILSGSEHYTLFGKPAAGTILNIHPIAWSGSQFDSTGSAAVTFVYASGLGTGPR